MKHSSLLLLLLISTTLFLSCARVDREQFLPEVYYAMIPSTSDISKTYIGTNYNIYWHRGDEISVFRSETNERFVVSGGEGDPLGEFRKTSDNKVSTDDALFSRIYSIFPYNSSTTCTSEGEVHTELPGTQYYAENSFGASAATMVAATDALEEDILYFKNVCGCLVIKVYGGDIVRKITLRGNNGEKISGEATITIPASEDESPSYVMGSDASDVITLDCGEAGVMTGRDKKNPTSFWLSVPPVTFTNGFTIEITNTAGTTMTKRTNKEITIVRGQFLSMYRIESNIQPGHEMLFFSISKGGQTYEAFDISNGRINIMVPNPATEKGLQDMTATFEYLGTSVSVGGAIKSSPYMQSFKFSKLPQEIKYKITDKDGNFSVDTVRVYDLPVLYIDSPAPVVSKDDWVDGTSIRLVTFDDETNGTKVKILGDGDAKVRCRGNSTFSSASKKSYTFKLSVGKKILGMPSDKRWNLLANHFDKSLIKNDIALEFARRSPGMAWNPHGTYVELILNGEYMGNYYLCEQIKVDKNRVAINEIDEDTYDINKTYTGGYLLDFDGHDGVAFSTSLGYPLGFKNPDFVPFNYTYIENWINDLEGKLSSSDISATDYLDKLDIDSFADYWIVNELVGNGELAGKGGSKNPSSCYMYKDADSTDVYGFEVKAKLYAGPCWDYDFATFESKWIVKDAFWFQYLFKDPVFVARVKERWNTLRPVYMELIDPQKPSYVDSVKNSITWSAKRDRLKWNMGTAPQEQADWVINDLRQKFEWMDTQIKSL